MFMSFNEIFSKNKTSVKQEMPKISTQIPVEEIVIGIGDSISKVSSIEAINYVNNKTIVHLKHGRFMEIKQSRDKHDACKIEYLEKLQKTLPNRHKG